MERLLKIFEMRLQELRNQIKTLNRILTEYPVDVLERKQLRKKYLCDCINKFELENRLLFYLDNPSLHSDSRNSVRDALQRLYSTLEKKIAKLHDAPCDLSDGALELAQMFAQSECDFALALLDR